MLAGTLRSGRRYNSLADASRYVGTFGLTNADYGKAKELMVSTQHRSGYRVNVGLNSALAPYLPHNKGLATVTPDRLIES